MTTKPRPCLALQRFFQTLDRQPGSGLDRLEERDR